MSSAATLLLADAEPATRGFLERHLPDDGFELVGAHARFDLVLAGDVADVDRWVDSVPVIVLGGEQADAVDRIHAFRQGCDDYVGQPFEYQELVALVSGSSQHSARTSFQVAQAPGGSVEPFPQPARASDDVHPRGLELPGKPGSPEIGVKYVKRSRTH